VDEMDEQFRPIDQPPEDVGGDQPSQGLGIDQPSEGLGIDQPSEGLGIDQPSQGFGMDQHADDFGMADAGIHGEAAAEQLDEAPGGDAAPAASAGKLKGLAGSAKGKMMLAGALVALVAVFGVVGYLVVSMLAGSGPANVSVTTAGVVTGESTSTAAGGNEGSGSGTETAGPGSAQALPEAFEVFENRDPFKPPLLPDVSSSSSSSSETESANTVSTGYEIIPEDSGGGSSSSSSSGGSSSGSTSDTLTLTLTKITYSGGRYHATFLYNGRSYTHEEGERIDSSPWDVLDITSSGALVRYGDGESLWLTL